MNVPDEKIIEVVTAPPTRAIMHAVRVDVDAKNATTGESLSGYALLFVANVTAAGAVIEAVDVAALHDTDPAKREAFRTLGEMMRNAVAHLDARAPAPQMPVPSHVH